MKFKSTIVQPLFKFTLVALAALTIGAAKAQSPPSNDAWSQMLSKYVDKEGLVDYASWKDNSRKLDQYLDKLSSTPPQDSWSKNEKIAYWINAYNAFTVKLIVKNYPLESIQDLHPTLHVAGLNTIWKKEFFKIGGKKTSLSHIEHGILREKFDEPRIHFAINCASMSCPKLRSEAYEAKKLDDQLTNAARGFINDPYRNKISRNQVKISKIFKWFTGDFTNNGSVIDFLNKYSDTTISQDAEIDYMEYNWELNEQ